jgi:hypothetical protein
MEEPEKKLDLGAYRLDVEDTYCSQALVPPANETPVLGQVATGLSSSPRAVESDLHRRNPMAQRNHQVVVNHEQGGQCIRELWVRRANGPANRFPGRCGPTLAIEILWLAEPGAGLARDPGDLSFPPRALDLDEDRLTAGKLEEQVASLPICAQRLPLNDPIAATRPEEVRRPEFGEGLIAARRGAAQPPWSTIRKRSCCLEVK